MEGSGSQATTGYTGRMEKIRIEQHGAMGGIWCAMWLFTIGFLKLGFWQGVLAIILWPYFLGSALSKFIA